MITLWGNADSVNVQKVVWTCEEIGVACHRIDAARHFGVTDTPAFRAMNPNGLVPTISDDGFVVWESNSIVRYLAAKHGAGTLWPDDPQARANADRWMDWTQSTLWPTLVPLFRAFMRTAEADRDARAIADGTADAIEVVAILDAHLASHGYVGGADFTMGDIAVGCSIWRWFALPLERPTFENVARWYDALAARPAYRKVVMTPLLR